MKQTGNDLDFIENFGPLWVDMRQVGENGSVTKEEIEEIMVD